MSTPPSQIVVALTRNATVDQQGHGEMVEYLKRAFAEGSQVTKFNLTTAAFVGSTAHFLFYFLFKYQFGLAENAYLRMIAVVLCVSLFFVHRLPEKVRSYLPYYWHFCIIFILPFIFTVNLLITDFHELWRYWAIFMVCVVVVYVPNILMILIDLSIGICSAIAFFVLTTPEVNLHPNFNVPLFSIVIIFTTFTIFLFSHYAMRGAQEIERAGVMRALAASIAHEMRNPLAQLNLSLDHIAQRLPKYYPDQQPAPISERELEDIYRQVAQGRMAATRGAQVIDMLLDEVNDKPIDTAGFEVLSAAQVTRRALDEYGYESLTERESLALQLEQDFTFRGDETLLVFVLFNLLKNALYYLSASRDGRIQITLHSDTEGNRIVFRDNGPGIKPETLKHLFDPFYTRGKKRGTGLGLAYCKRVMESFGGGIRCASDPGHFTEFTLTFPKAASGKTRVAGDACPLPRDARFAGRRLLVVDDDSLQRNTAAERLRALGAEVVEAGNGREAVDQLRGQSFDVVLMDLLMPVMNGYEAAETIRSGEAGEAARRVPIIACTSEPEYLARTRIERIGMQGLLNKPCSEARLIHGIVPLFDFQVPLLDSLHSPMKSPDDGGHEEQKTLLVVDDSSSMRRSLELFLTGEGFKVLQAGEGQEALEVMRDHPCDLVITDMNMPGMDGFELARRIRADDAISFLPIMGLSGFSDRGLAQTAREAGIDAYLGKGADFGEMVDLIRSLLSSRIGDETSFAGFDPNLTATALRIPRAALKAHLEGIPLEYCSHPQQLRKALVEEDWERLRLLAHKLVGLAKLIRFPALAALAEGVETQAREERGEGMEAVVEQLCTMLSGLIRDIGNL